MRSHRNQNGHVVVILAAVIAVLLGFTALGIDMGMLYSARASAQRAADAAALAGAFVFVTHPTLTSGTAEAVIDQYAIGAAAQNKVLGTTVTIGAGDVDVDFANRRVTVRVNSTQPTFFARILGSNSANIHAEAVAEAAHNATGDRCTKPWFIPNTVLAPDDREICDKTNNAGVTTQGACSLGELLIDPNTGTITQFAIDWMAAQDALAPNQNPRRFTIKPQNPNNAISPGQFFAIRLGDSTGGQDYETNIKNCPAEPIYCADSYASEPGNMVGPTRQGINTLVNYNKDPNCNNCARDIYEGISKYRRPGPPDSDGGLGSTSRSLVIAPVIDVCLFCPDNFPSGTTSAQFTVIGFAMVFLEGIQGNDVQARLISLTACTGGGGGGGGGGGINPEETGPLSIPVRLVRI